MLKVNSEHWAFPKPGHCYRVFLVCRQG